MGGGVPMLGAIGYRLPDGSFSFRMREPYHHGARVGCGHYYGTMAQEPRRISQRVSMVNEMRS